MTKEIHIIGAGLAGSEAALAAARLGVKVNLHEMRPEKTTPAHTTQQCAELVCSNSLGGDGNTNAKGLLQAEMKAVGSVIMQAASEARIPAGNALAVDREIFSAAVTREVEGHPRIEVLRQEVMAVPRDAITVLATGPLTSDALAADLRQLLGGNFLSFYDAAAPVVLGESIDRSIVFRAGRYGQDADYLNCPMDRAEYTRFFEVLGMARKHVPHDWEKLEFFEGCIPIEELGRRGFDTLRFGPLKPIGLKDPRTGKGTCAIVQLRAEDRAERMWSLVGFQTGLKWPDQKELVQTIPGLEKAEIVRYGVMHRNTYLDAPKLIQPTLQFREHADLLVAGVLSGVEGYLESAATGWLAGRNAARRVLGQEAVVPPPESMLGALVHYLATSKAKDFQPMNSNWGLVPAFEEVIPKQERKARMYSRGLEKFESWKTSLDSGALTQKSPS